MTWPARTVVLTALVSAAALASCTGEPTAEPAPAARAGKGRKAPKPPRVVAPKPPAPDAPNVLILVWDTVRADHLSTYGYARQTTPWLDGFAKEAVVYERAISPAMWTLPSHASLFTGLPESAHGATADHKWLDGRFPTMAELYGAFGYDTFLFSANPYLEDHNLDQGFDAVEFPWDRKWKKKAEAATLGKLIPDDASTELSPKYVEGEFPSGRPADRVKDAGPVAGEALLSWVDRRAEKDRPWLAVVNYMEAHAPRIPTRASREALFDAANIAEQLKHDQSYGYLLAYTVGVHEFTPAQLTAITDVYDASLRDLDQVTGQLVDQLRARGELDDTIVVITSDHGEHLGEHHLLDHKYSVYNALVHVPLIVRYPAKLSPARVADVVSNLAVWPALSELTGAPTAPTATLAPSFLGPAGRSGEAFSELTAATPMALQRMQKVRGGQFEWGPFLRTYAAVQTATQKCIRSVAKDGGDVREQVYDLVADPLELAGVPAASPSPCARIDGWRGTFMTYDAAQSDIPTRESSKNDARLKALGYLEAQP